MVFLLLRQALSAGTSKAFRLSLFLTFLHVSVPPYVDLYTFFLVSLSLMHISPLICFLMSQIHRETRMGRTIVQCPICGCPIRFSHDFRILTRNNFK